MFQNNKKKYKNKKNSSYTNTYNQQYTPKIRRVEFQNGLGCICMSLPATENFFSFYFFYYFSVVFYYYLFSQWNKNRTKNKKSNEITWRNCNCTCVAQHNNLRNNLVCEWTTATKNSKKKWIILQSIYFIRFYCIQYTMLHISLFTKQHLI